MVNENNVVHVNFVPQFEDVYGVDNDNVSLILQHNKKTKEIQFIITTKSNERHVLKADSLKSVGFLMALEEVVDPQS